jgi:hypothetical protein
MSLIPEDARLPVIERLCHYAVARSVKVNVRAQSPQTMAFFTKSMGSFFNFSHSTLPIRIKGL